MVCDLPRTQVFDYYGAEKGDTVEFRLIYQGPLPAEGVDVPGKKGRAEDKQILRKCFHKQLRELWEQDLSLKTQASMYCIENPVPATLFQHVDPAGRTISRVPPNYAGAKKYIDRIADDHIRCNGNRFVPLVSLNGGFTCALDILFLRRDDPGNLIESGGDIDNRIKVLLDGLRMPKDVKELGGLPIELDEDPFYCLLEDDKLITSISVTTDRLIIPQQSGEHKNDVVLVIHVTIVNPMQLFAGGRMI
jgi:hypothetical protein